MTRDDAPKATYLERPREEPVKGSPPKVKERVSEMLLRIEGGGVDVVRARSVENFAGHKRQADLRMRRYSGVRGTL